MFLGAVPPSVMMPSHCRCEGRGLGLVWGMEGREGGDESESHRCRAARRAAQGGRWAAERTSTPPPRLDLGATTRDWGLLATHPTRPRHSAEH